MLETVKTVRIFTAPFNCPYCDRAKALCERFGIKYVEVVGHLPEGCTTYPQIYFDHEHIGGCQELFNLLRNSKFDDV